MRVSEVEIDEGDWKNAERPEALPGGDHQEAAPGRGGPWQRADSRPGLPEARDLRADVSSLESPVWRHEDRRAQAPEGTRGRESEAQAARRGSGFGYPRPEGDRPGKVVGPSSKRCAAEHLKSTGVSERRACRLLEQSRSSQRYQPSRKDEEKRLVERMLELVRAHPRRGYRMIWSMLVAEGWKVNRKRIYRLWRREGLRVPKKKHKKTRLGKPENGCTRKKAARKNHVWAWDFGHDRTQDGRPLKWLALVDEYTRELVALKVERSIKAKDAVKLLEEVFAKRGTPEHLRSDNGPEFIAQAMRQHLEKSGVSTLYIEPGAPWENGYAESFNSRFRDEFLGCEEFTSLLEAKVI